MRIMLIALLALPLAAPANAQQHPPRSTAKTGERCAPTSTIARGREWSQGRAAKLGDMPPATAIYALYNMVDGC